MDKKTVEERLAKLEQERDQIKTTLIAYEGAIQECKFWVEQHKEEVKEEN